MPHPMYAPIEPEEDPSATTRSRVLTTDASKLEFHAVAGFSTLPRELMLNNEGSLPLGVRATIRGPHAGMFSHSAMYGTIVQPASSNALPEMLGVSYHPTEPGQHTARLLLATETGVVAVDLFGEALKGRPGGAARARAGSPEAAREKALEAATESARLAPEYMATIAQSDSAVDAFGARIVAAGTNLNAKLVSWLAEEGVTAAYATEQGAHESNATDITKFFALEVAELGLDAAAMMNPISAAALVAVDLGWDMVETGIGNTAATAQRKKTEGRLQSVSSWAGEASSDVTRALVQRYSGLVVRYERAKAALRGAADTGDELRDLHTRFERHESPDPSTETLHTLRATYERSAQEVNLVVRAMAAEAAQAEPRAAQAFATLLDRYLRFRVTGDPDAPAHTREIITIGYLNPDVPRPVGLTSTTIGSVDAQALSSSVSHVATHRLLREMTGWNVTVRLSTSNGEITLHQLTNGERVQVVPDSAMPLVERIGGLHALWDAVDRARLGA